MLRIAAQIPFGRALTSADPDAGFTSRERMVRVGWKMAMKKLRERDCATVRACWLLSGAEGRSDRPPTLPDTVRSLFNQYMEERKRIMPRATQRFQASRLPEAVRKEIGPAHLGEILPAHRADRRNPRDLAVADQEPRSPLTKD